jgi:hypothetical protein
VYFRFALDEEDTRMAETKKCPKCSGNMVQGNLMKISTYGTPPFVYAPVTESGFMPPVKGQPNLRHGIILFRCERCAFVEMYAP